MRRFRLMVVLAAVCLLVGALVGVGGIGLAQEATPAASPAAAVTFEVGGVVQTPLTLTVADLQALGLTAETVEVTYQSGGESESHTFTGVRLLDLITSAGIPAGADERNPLLRHYVVVTANDGYQVVFSGGELDPKFGAAPILVAWEQDGPPLAGEDGPVRLAAPGDLRGGRYVFGVVGIDLSAVESPTAATPAA